MRSIFKKDGTVSQSAPLRPTAVVERKPKKKMVRFDDMILIGDDTHQIQLFLSDEEASIIEKKATPTKLNLQSSAELRKRMRKEKAARNAQINRPVPKIELTIDKVIESKKRRRAQTQHFGQEEGSSEKTTKTTNSPDVEEAGPDSSE